MRILLAEEVGGHPFWDARQYIFVLIDTDTATARRLPVWARIPQGVTYNAIEYYVSQGGVTAQLFACGSGYGKAPLGDPFEVIHPDEFDTLVMLWSEKMRQNEREYCANGYHLNDNSDFR